MALRATERAKTPAGASIPSRTKGSRSAHVEMLSTPLDLAPLVAPYRKYGKLSFRVERMPQTTRLSQGRNNGNGSYSLQPDELHGLEYVFPAGMGADTPVLSLRIVGLDQDGATLAILDVEVPPNAGRPSEAGSNVDKGLLQRQRDEVESLKRALAERDKELAQLRRASGNASPETIREHVEQALAEARDAWNLELEQHLSAAEAQAASLIEQSRKIWAAEQDVRFAEAREHWRQESEQALVDMRTRCEHAEAALREARNNPPKSDDSAELKKLRDDLAALRMTLSVRDNALAQAKINYEDAELRWRHQAALDIKQAEEKAKAEAAEQLAQARKEWQHSAERTLADAHARLEKAESAIRDASNTSQSNDGELRKLRAALEAAQASLAERERSLSDARDIAQSKDTEIRRLQEELVTAKSSAAAFEKSLSDTQDVAQSKDNENRRLREELGAAKSSVATLEKSLSDVRLDKQSHDAELRKLRDELTAASAERDKVLADALSSSRSKEQELQALRDQLEAAQSALTDRERALSDARAMAASSEDDLRRLREELVAAKASLAERERARSETGTPSESDEADRQRLREELAAARAMLDERDKSVTAAQAVTADRDHEIEKLREELKTATAAGIQESAARDEARASWQKEHDEALAKAKAAWAAETDQRLTETEAALKNHYEEIIAQLSAQVAASNAGFAQTAAGSDTPADDGEVALLREQLTELQIRLAQKENEIEHARLAMGSSDGGFQHISIDQEPMRRREADDETRERRKATIRLVIEMAAAAALAGSIAIFYPRVMAMLPDEWVYQIDNASEGIKTAIFGYPPVTAAPTPTQAPAAATLGRSPHQGAEIVHGGNLRSGPSGSAAIVTTLPRGIQVAVLQRHDDWTEIAVKMTDGSMRQGWIFSSFLKPSHK